MNKLTDPTSITNVMYASTQLYSIELAKLLQTEFSWQPLYFFTQPKYWDMIEGEFPEAIRHHYYDAVKGIPPEELADFSLLPTDIELLDKLAEYEPIALWMMERNDSNSDSFTYRERVEFYQYLVRYWTSVLKDKNIEVVVFEEEPHQVNDYVLYVVCIALGVETIMSVRTISDLGIIPVQRFEAGSEMLIQKYKELLETYEEGEKVELPTVVERYIQKLNGSYDMILEDHLWDQVDRVRALGTRFSGVRLALLAVVGLAGKLFDLKAHLIRLRFVLFSTYDSDQKVRGKSIYESKQSYLRSLFYKALTRRKKAANKRYYESVAASNLNLKTPYVFCALQYQPEKTTCPLGGRFVNQLTLIELLAQLLPPGWQLYVKEHPSQFVPDYTRYGDQFRSPAFYDRVSKMEGCKWVSLREDVFSLVDHSKAVASIGGTVCWEAVVRGTPALSFGHAWFNACEGVFKVGKVAELKHALDQIEQGYVPDEAKVRLFAKALSSLGFNAVIGGDMQLEYKKVSALDNAKGHFAAYVELLTQTAQS